MTIMWMMTEKISVAILFFRRAVISGRLDQDEEMLHMWNESIIGSNGWASGKKDIDTINTGYWQWDS